MHGVPRSTKKRTKKLKVEISYEANDKVCSVRQHRGVVRSRRHLGQSRLWFVWSVFVHFQSPYLTYFCSYLTQESDLLMDIT